MAAELRWRDVDAIPTSMLHDLLPLSAARCPGGEAVVGLTARCTWAELDDATRAMASGLRRAGVEPGDRVAVSGLKDLPAYVAVHAVLRAGAVVVPVDPLAPPAAACAVLADAEPAAVLGDARTLARLEPATSVLCGPALVVAWDADGVDDASAGACDGGTTWDALLAGGGDPMASTSSSDPAYLIYTSGSTGRPKGIVHTHASAMAYADRVVRHHGITAADRVAGMSALHFDMSTLELYAAPLAGASVVVMGESQLRFPASFTARSEAEHVSVWYTVPALLRQVAARGALDQRDLRDLRLVMYGGEPYPPGALAELMAALPHVVVRNVYGPAEVNECTSHTVAAPPGPEDETPIGLPWSGVDLLVVDDAGAPVAAGEAGELWVSAPTVMAGYWKQPERTAAGLVARDDGPPWYRTGDLVVQGDDGLYRFRGRRDHQVKVRGVRLELEGVESVLTDAPGVLHAVAVPVGPPGAVEHIEAVVVARDGATVDADAVRRWCAARLAAVAVPRQVHVVAALPTTPSGKIDRRRVREEVGHRAPAGVSGEEGRRDAR